MQQRNTYVNPYLLERSSSEIFSATSNLETDADVISFSERADAIVEIDPKEAVKLFGRLAEKYIMLDESGGSCCFSACSDCEYRLPGGGYKMADQSASRPKWVPSYEERSFSGQNKAHVSKWKNGIFGEASSVTKEAFVDSVSRLEFATPLGGPFVSKSAGAILDDTSATEFLFDVLSEGKDVISSRTMSKRLKDLSDGSEGLTWPNFSAALGL